MDKRKRMGKDKEGVIFPVAPNLSEMGDSYLQFIEEIKKEIQKQRVSVVMNANTSMICLYWNIGRAILKKQEEEGWGAKVIDRMSKDLKIAFPEMSGFSPRNIKYMRKFAQCWGDYEIVQRVVAQLPWRTNITLMDKLKTQEERIWYAGKTIENGWSKTILELQIQSKLMERTGKTVNNFPVALPPLDSDMANQIFKDPYLFDFLGTDMPRREVEIEQKLTEHIQSFLLELGQGFAFVGRQVHLEVGGQDFYLDLLFYHFNGVLIPLQTAYLPLYFEMEQADQSVKKGACHAKLHYYYRRCRTTPTKTELHHCTKALFHRIQYSDAHYETL